MTDNLRGIIAVLIGSTAFVMNDALVKLASPELPASQINMMRGTVATILLAGICSTAGAWRPLSVLLSPMMLLRVGTAAAASLFIAVGLRYMPLPTMTTVMQVAPLAVTAGAAVVYGERVGWRRWLAVLSGFLGVVLIVKPGAGTFGSAAYIALSSPERPLLAVLGTFGELSSTDDAPEHVEGAPPDLPAPEDCVAMVGTDTFPPPFMRRVDLRLHPDDAGFTRGRPTGRPRVRGWFRLPGDEPVDPLALLCAVDAFPPTIFNADLPVAWTPTVELTAHVRSRPVPGWLACSFSTRFVSGGFLEADGEVWDAAGRLVAQSRQLALVPRG